MQVAIVITTPDYAGLNVKKILLDNYAFEEMDQLFDEIPIYNLKNNFHNITLYTTNKKCVFCEDFDKLIEADLFIFPTTHRSAANTNSLSCHTQGNWADADLGGQPRNLSIAPALFLKEIFRRLSIHADSIDEDITMECTHHGPKIEKPTIFVEIGSNETQWKRTDLGKINSDVIMGVLSSELFDLKTAIGFGGTHYCANFNSIQNNSDIAIGHICPKYMLEKIDKEMIEQAIEKTMPRPEIAIIDWKGMGAQKQRIVSILNELNITIMKTRELK